MSCDAAVALIGSYFDDPSLQRAGNTQAAEFDGWLCVSPTSASAKTQGYGTRCTREDDVSDIVVVPVSNDESPSAACTPESISTDVGRFPSGGLRCYEGWAYVDWGQHGDSQALLRLDGDRWQVFTGFPTTLCTDDARVQGVPEAELGSFPPCRSAPATPTSIDLGIATPITTPVCDGLGIVIVHSATQPGAYVDEISTALAAHPGAQYLRTDRSCPSLRQQSADGNPIYAAFRPAGYSVDELCDAVRREGDSAYGKWLDTTTDPNFIVSC